jgi:hypothetical protein
LYLAIGSAVNLLLLLRKALAHLASRVFRHIRPSRLLLEQD